MAAIELMPMTLCGVTIVTTGFNGSGKLISSYVPVGSSTFILGLSIASGVELMICCLWASHAS